MMRPQISIAPVCTPPDGGKPPIGLFVDGVLVRGLKALVADVGGDVLVVLDRAAVQVDPTLRPALPAPSPEFGREMYVPRGPLPTDGQA